MAKKIQVRKKTTIPTGSHIVGSIHFLGEASKKIKLLKVLKKVFPEDYEKILYLSFFKITGKEAYYLYPLWCEEVQTPKESFLTSQAISELLSEIGKDEKKVENFFMKWINQNSVGSKAVMFDITSISSYGYRLYPGSINDVSTLNNIISLAAEYKLDLKCLVLDKGFVKKTLNLFIRGVYPISFP